MRLSLNPRQQCWVEEVPKVPVLRLITSKKKVKQHGYFHRKGERVSYVLNLEKGIVWFRYAGDKRFTHHWQGCLFDFHRSGRSGGETHVQCPFCRSRVSEIWVFCRTLRCSNCVHLESKWKKQLRISRSRRRKIEQGDYLFVAEGLASGKPQEVFQMMIAMEMSGLSPKKLTIDKAEQVWVLERYKL